MKTIVNTDAEYSVGEEENLSNNERIKDYSHETVSQDGG
jgi:hypothetical protein